MSVRDLGYRAYEGDRLPASHNTWVMLRHSLGRAWASWLVKIPLFVCVLAPIVMGAFTYVTTHFLHGGPTPGLAVVWLLRFELWTFVLATTLGSGAAAISEDLQHRAFQFFFAKPVTVAQYLGGRIGAVAIISFCVSFVPAFLMILVFAGIQGTDGSQDDVLEWVGLILPALVQSALLSVVTGAIAVGLSSLSRSRALTMTLWLILFILPAVLSGLVELLSSWPWLSLASVTSMLTVVGSALFKQTTTGDLRWYHALPVLVGLTAGSIWLAYARLRRAEVIT